MCVKTNTKIALGVVGGLIVGCILFSPTEQQVVSEEPQEVEQQEVDSQDVSQEQTEEKEEEKQSITLQLTPGTYIVGEDLEEGEYVVLVNEGEFIASYERRTGTSGDYGEVVTHEYIEGLFAYMEVKDGEYLKLDGCTLYKIDELNLDFSENDKLSNGMFIVGQDLEPGEYKLVAMEESYDGTKNGQFGIYKDVSGDWQSTVRFDYFENSTYITVKEGQYLVLSENTVLEK